MGTEHNDVLAQWKQDCLDQFKRDDEEMIRKFAEEEGISIDLAALNANIPDNFMDEVLDNPILDFADMMIRMQRALFLQSQAKKPDPAKPDPEQVMKAECEKDGFDWNYGAEANDNELECKITVAPELIDVKKATELFWNGGLDAYLVDAETNSNNLQRQLILSLGGSEENTDEESCDSILAPLKCTHEETSSSHSPTKKPNIPQLHPLNTNGRKGTSLSARAQAIPNPNASAKVNNVNLDVSKQHVQALTSPLNRKLAVAVRRNPGNSNPLRQRVQPSVPQRVSIRPSTSADSLPKVVSVESLQNSPFKLQVSPGSQNSPKGIIPSSAMNLPSAITVLPAQPDKQGVLYPNQKSDLSSKPTVLLRPASARKSPHKSTMYTNAVNPVPIKPKTPDMASPFKYVPIQPRLSVGQHMTSNDSGNTDAEENNADEMMPQIMSTEGGVSSFVSKLNSLAREAPKIAIPPEKVRSPIKPVIAQGSWLLGCQTCGLTYPFLCDNKYRQHLMIDHSIEVDDKEIQAIKFFAKTMFKCKKCQAVFFKNREDHHKKCTPNVKIEEAFQEVPFSNRDPEIIKCGICNTVFDTRLDLRGHLAEKHREVVNSTLVDPKYRCSRCLKAFVDSGTLTSHVARCIATHSEKDSILEIARSLLMCDICQRTHYSVNEVQICYANKKLIRCMLCLYTCISRQNFIAHMTNFHRKNKVGITCPFCPASEVAPVRAQFEHIVSHHYNPAIEAYESRKASMTTLPPVPVPKGIPKVIGIPVSQSVLQANLLNTNSRPIYRRNAAGNLVLSHISPGTSLRPLRPTTMGNRPVLMNTAAIGSTGNIRYMIAPPRQTVNNPNIMRQHTIFKTIPSGSPINILTTKIGGETSTDSTSVTLSNDTTESINVPVTSSPIASVNVIPANIRPVTPSNIRAVTPVSIRPVNPANIRSVTPVSIRCINPANIRSITPVSIRSITPANIRSITPANIRTMNAVNIRPNNPVNIRPVNTAHIRSVGTANIRSINPANLRPINPAYIRSINAASIRCVTPVNSSPTTPVINTDSVTTSVIGNTTVKPVNPPAVSTSTTAAPANSGTTTATTNTNNTTTTVKNGTTTKPVNPPVASTSTTATPTNTNNNTATTGISTTTKPVNPPVVNTSTTTTPISTKNTTSTAISSPTTKPANPPAVNTSNTATPANSGTTAATANTNNTATTAVSSTTTKPVNPPVVSTSTTATPTNTNNTATTGISTTTKPVNPPVVNTSTTATPISTKNTTTTVVSSPTTKPVNPPVVNTNTTATPVSTKITTTTGINNTTTKPVNPPVNTSVKTAPLNTNNATTSQSNARVTASPASTSDSNVSSTAIATPVSSSNTNSISNNVTSPDIINTTAGNNTPVNRSSTPSTTGSSGVKAVPGVVRITPTNNIPVITGITGSTGRPKVIGINSSGGNARVVSIGSIPFSMRPKIANNSNSSSSPGTPVTAQVVNSSTPRTPVSRPIMVVGGGGKVIGSTFIKPLATSTPNSAINSGVTKYCQIAPKPTSSISSVTSATTKVVGEASLPAPENNRSSNLDNDSVLEEINMNEETAEIDTNDSILGF